MGNDRPCGFAVGGFTRDADVTQLIVGQFEQMKACVPELPMSEKA
jgi:hypothetical protein